MRNSAHLLKVLSTLANEYTNSQSSILNNSLDYLHFLNCFAYKVSLKWRFTAVCENQHYYIYIPTYRLYRLYDYVGPCIYFTLSHSKHACLCLREPSDSVLTSKVYKHAGLRLCCVLSHLSTEVIS